MKIKKCGGRVKVVNTISFYPIMGFPSTPRQRRRYDWTLKDKSLEGDTVVVQANEPVREESSSVKGFIISEDRESFQQLANRLHFVSAEILDRCIKFGNGYYLLSKKMIPGFIRDFPDHLPGGYSPALKACILRQEALLNQNLQFLPLILLGHAYDHAVGGGHFASQQSPLLQSLYLACKRRKRNHQFMSRYGESGPREYFAEGLAFYFSPDLQVKETLKRLDRMMFDYLEMLFKSLQ